MANKKKPEMKEEKSINDQTESMIEQVESTSEQVESPIENKSKSEKPQKTNGKQPKYPVGSIVFIHKEADADLNGFKLFPQYKKYTYTVEAYNASEDVYSLRRLNLSLRLKECDIIAPHEKSGSALMSKQY